MEQITRISSRWSSYFVITPILLATLMALSFANDPESKSSWPGWRGHGNDGIVNDTNVFAQGDEFGLRVRWKVDIGSGYSGISIADGIAVTMFANNGHDYMVAFDATTGGERWRYRIEETHLGRFGSMDGPISTPLIADGRVYGLGARGTLFALDITDGKPLWKHDLVEGYNVRPAMIYGFATSPIRYDNTLIVQTSNADGSAVTGFDLASGELLWKAGSDSVGFQSPILIEVNGKPQILVPAAAYLYGLEPSSGQILWEFKHSERPGFRSVHLNPVEIAKNTVYLKNLQGKLKSIKINEVEGSFSVEEVWETRELQRSYVVPVVHGGYIYGLNGRFFSCFDAQSGKTVWKSRQPGDGFPILIDGHLVTLTKKGSLHLAKASPENYEDMASIKLFDDLAWTPPSYVDGHVFVRSFGELACVEIVPEVTSLVAGEIAPGRLTDSKFTRFIESLEHSVDKTRSIDEFMAKQDRFPVIEDDSTVHFIYRGQAEDIAISNEQIGNRMDHPMHHVPGTDLYYYSTRIEPDARIVYQFLRNTVEGLNDSLNPETMINYRWQRWSLLTMPQWPDPEHLKQSTRATGRVDTVNFVGHLRGDSLRMHVYLPVGYDEDTNRRYPTAYILDSRGAQQVGLMNRTLDNLVGVSVEPLIVVYVYPIFGGWYKEYVGDDRDKFYNMLVQELIPHIDTNYRSRATADSRAAIGGGDAAFMALYAAAKSPDNFSRIGMQSTTWGDMEKSIITAHIKDADKQPLRIYHDWAKYDYRSPLEGTNIPLENIRLVKYLKANGYVVTGEQANDGGSTWANYRNRSHLMLQTLFPLE